MPTEGIISAGDLLALVALIVTILIAVWRMNESARKDTRELRRELREDVNSLNSTLLESRRESTREHRELELKFEARFQGIEDAAERDRRFVRAMLG